MKGDEILAILKKDMDTKPHDSHVMLVNDETGESVDYSVRTSFRIPRSDVEKMARKRLHLTKKSWSVIGFWQKRVWGV